MRRSRVRGNGAACFVVARRQATLLTRIRPERDHGTEQEDEAREPDQVDERLDEDTEVDRPVVVHLLRDHEQVLAGQVVRPDSDLRRDLGVGAGDRVGVLARLQRPEGPTVPAHQQMRPYLGGMRRVALGQALERDRVARHREGLTGRELPLHDRVVRARAGDPDREQDDCDMDDVPAVAAAVAPDQREECSRPRLARQRPPRSRAAHELEPDRGEHERSERVGDQTGDRRAGAEADEHDAGHDGDHEGPEEGSPEAAQRGPTPGDQRADAHQEEQRQAEDAEEEVVVRPTHDDRRATDGLRQDRPGDAPEDRQAERHEQQVVVEEDGLPRDERLELRRRAEQRQPPDDQRRRERDGDHDEREEPWPDVALRERVDRVDDPGTRQERAEDREAEREGDEHDVPDLEHPPLLLDHHRVEERGRGEEGHQGGVLDRIPRVVPAPADLDVRPVGAEQLADAQARPGDQRPASRRDDPPLVGAPREQRPHRERERHGQAHVAEVEERRVRDHVRVLQAGVQARTVERRRLSDERARDDDEEERERDRDASEDRCDPHDQVARPIPVDPDRERGVAGQDQEPEEQRPLLPTPHRGKLVRARERPVGVLGDVGEGEVVAEEPGREHGGSHEGRAEGRDQRITGRMGEPAASPRRRVRPCDRRVEAEAERDDERRPPELDHL